MANPLYHATLEELLEASRASKIPEASDAYRVVEQSLLAAIVYIQSAMGIQEATLLAVEADVCPPTTDRQLKRAHLKLAESNLFLAELMTRLPYLATDGSSYAFEEFDKNSIFRSMTQGEILEVVSKLRKTADQNLSEAGATKNLSTSIGIFEFGNPLPVQQLFSFPKGGPIIHGY
jgi:hypothetical protein